MNKNRVQHAKRIHKMEQLRMDSRAAANTTYPKGGFSCYKESFAVDLTLVFLINFCVKNPALRLVAKHYMQS
jgi:hypothetical protein